MKKSKTKSNIASQQIYVNFFTVVFNCGNMMITLRLLIREYGYVRSVWSGAKQLKVNRYEALLRLACGTV